MLNPDIHQDMLISASSELDPETSLSWRQARVRDDTLKREDSETNSGGTKGLFFGFCNHLNIKKTLAIYPVRESSSRYK